MQQEIEKSPDGIKPIKTYQVILPALLGIIVVAGLFLKEFDPSIFTTFSFSFRKILFLSLALLVIIFIRDGSLMWRFRILTDQLISWRQAFNIHILSEFTSVITPTSVGGSSLVIYFLIKEGISSGRSTTIMIVNLFLDELFFLIACPVLFLIFPINEMFPPSVPLVYTIGYIFAGLYIFILIWTLILFVGIFIRPDWIKRILLWIFRLPVLKRWRKNVDNMTDDLICASQDIKNRPFGFWLKLCFITATIWISRFLIVNLIFAAFVSVSNHLLVFARQVVLWILMIAMPTPGGSGISEFVFKEYYSDLFLSGSLILIVVVIWRFVSFYLYLLLGVLILPRWFQRAIKKSDIK